MQNQGTGLPSVTFDISFDESTLSLDFDIELTYVGDSSDPQGLGTTYVIDFYSFGPNGNLIDKPGNCQNRLASSYDSLSDFNSYWGYSETPNVAGNLGVNTYMSYPPPSSFRTLSSNGCTNITYQDI